MTVIIASLAVGVAAAGVGAAAVREGGCGEQCSQGNDDEFFHDFLL